MKKYISVLFVSIFVFSFLNINYVSAVSASSKVVIVPGPVATRGLADLPASLSATFNVAASTASQFVPVGNTGANDFATKATYSFYSAGNTSTISELKFTVNGSNVQNMRLGNIVSVPVVNGVAYFTGLNLQVPNGGSGLNVDAFASYYPIGINGVVSGSTSSIALTSVKYSSAGVTTTMTSFVSAPTMKIVASVPTLALSASNSTLTAGLANVGNVTVSADSKGSISLYQLPINIAISNVAFTNNVPVIVVKDANNNVVSTTANTSFSGTTGSLLSTLTFNTMGYVIPAGTSQTFKIFVQVASLYSGGPTPSLTLSLGNSNLLSWIDTAGNGAPITIANGTYFYNYPTNAVSIFGSPSSLLSLPPKTPVRTVTPTSN